MKKKKPPEWLRWVYLAMAVFCPFAAWMDFKDYPQYRAWGMFDEEQWGEIMNGFHFHWAVCGLMVACWLYLFFVRTWDKDDSRNHRWLDEAFATVLTLSWACLPLLMPIPSSAQALWTIVLIACAVITGRSWIKYFENTRLEEETYE